MKHLSVILLLISVLGAYGDVFSLWPFRGGVSLPGGGAEDFLNPQRLWGEKVIVNGRALEMGVALVDRPFPGILRELRRKYPNVPMAVNSNSVLFELQNENGSRRRLFLVAFEGTGSVVLFSLDVPPNGFSSVPQWPAELPLPPGATPLTVMRFPGRNSVYGMFRTPYGKQAALSDLAGLLRAGGWESAGKESGSSPASGDVFMRRDASEILLIGIAPGRDGSTSTGTLYLRRLK